MSRAKSRAGASKWSKANGFQPGHPAHPKAGRPKNGIGENSPLRAMMLKCASPILQRLLQSARRGDTESIQILAQKILPREPLIQLSDVQPIMDVSSAREALRKIFEHCISGRITCGEAASLSTLARNFVD